MAIGGKPDWDTSKRAIGERIVAARQARGFNQLKLAQALGMSSQRLNNYETGKSTPPPDVLARISALTGATADYVLFGRMDGMPYELAQKILSETPPAAGGLAN